MNEATYDAADEEVRSIAMLLGILQRMGPDERRRALNYLTDRFGD